MRHNETLRLLTGGWPGVPVLEHDFRHPVVERLLLLHSVPNLLIVKLKTLSNADNSTHHLFEVPTCRLLFLLDGLHNLRFTDWIVDNIVEMKLCGVLLEVRLFTCVNSYMTRRSKVMLRTPPSVIDYPQLRKDGVKRIIFTHV